MKIRSGFVSNSSSSSFLLEIKNVTLSQRDYLWSLQEAMLKKGWVIVHNFPVIFGYTSMDNFDLKAYLKTIGFPVGKITWFHSNDGLPKTCVFEKTMTKHLKALVKK